MDSKGFTLIELIVAITIMSVVFAIVVPQYSKYVNSRALSLAQEQIAGDIRMTQNYALNIPEVGGSFPDGYGVRFIKDSSVYIVFTDGDGDKIYKSDGSEKFQDIEMSGGIKINSLKIEGLASDPVDLVFAPSYGVTYINGVNKSLGNFIDLEIEIINKDNDTKTITVRSSGLIN